MSEEKKNLEENKLTDEQAEQVSGGRRRPRCILEENTEESGKNSLKAPSLIDTDY